MFIIYQIGRMSIIMYLPSMVLSNLTGINVNILIIVMGVIAIIYSSREAEIRTLDGLYSGLRAADWCHLCAYLFDLPISTAEWDRSSEPFRQEIPGRR